MQGISALLKHSDLSTHQITNIFVIHQAQDRALKNFKKNNVCNPYGKDTLAYAAYHAMALALIQKELTL